MLSNILCVTSSTQNILCIIESYYKFLFLLFSRIPYMRCRNLFHRRRSGQHYPPRTARCPSPTRLRRAARDATRCLAQLEPRQCAVSSKWSERPHPTWVQCTAGDCCAETTSLCALDTAQQLPLWFHLWHYRSVYYIISIYQNKIRLKNI